MKNVPGIIVVCTIRWTHVAARKVHSACHQSHASKFTTVDSLTCVRMHTHSTKTIYAKQTTHLSQYTFSRRGPQVDEHGNKYWRNSEGYIHREDGPAIEGANGSKFWFIDGKRHRVDGPAVERANGRKFWYFDGKQYLFEDWLGQLQISNEEKVMLCLKWK